MSDDQLVNEHYIDHLEAINKIAQITLLVRAWRAKAAEIKNRRLASPGGQIAQDLNSEITLGFIAQIVDPVEGDVDQCSPATEFRNTDHIDQGDAHA